jgi:PBP1b-binding outer membrane lipoprotein LpoB|tara:strand:+ start:55 stop:585 length:531 start_codon:yes stop_codon:yes gene_type:complete
MKKHIYFFAALVGIIVLSSCNSVRVASDYDTKANFNNYKTFAYFKTGIDKAEINDIDKRRILRAIESEMIAKGFTKSVEPDLLVSIFTKSRENVNVNRNNFGWGFGWGFYGASFGTSVSTSTEGTLYIDLIDAKTNELVWQGQGSGYLTKNVKKKQERINEFVEEILEAYPPEMDR